MENFNKLSQEKLLDLKNNLYEKYFSFKEMNLNLDMSRGKPCKEQLDLSNQLLSGKVDFERASFDVRNYGVLSGLSEVKEIFSKLLDIPKGQIIIGGNSSLNLLYDCVVRLYIWGSFGSLPWGRLEKVKILCITPGYDRHFAIFEKFGFELVPIDFQENKVNIDLIEKLVAEDESIKGIVCVPVFSNPTGDCYSDDVISRLVKMKTKAEDFKIFWDNAYAIHYIYQKVEVLNILREAKKYNNEDRVLYFFSTSKINFAGAGISLLASGEKFILETLEHLGVQTIGYDKVNQLRTFEFFKSVDNIYKHMDSIAQILRPKFDVVLQKLRSEFENSGVLTWSEPLGGYFISVYTLDGCASSVVKMCREVGLILTDSNATYPKGKNFRDRNIRLAPSYPSLQELFIAIEIFSVCVKIVSIEKILKEKFRA